MCGVCGQLYDWQKPNRLLTLQIGDTANEQVVFPAYGGPGGECDNLICTLKHVMNLMKGKKLGVVVTSSAEIAKNRLAEVLKLVHFGGQCKGVSHHG